MFGVGALIARMTSQRGQLHLPSYGTAVVVYSCFAVASIARLPPWVAVVTTMAGTVVSLAVGPSYTLVGPCLLASVFLFAMLSEKTPTVIAAGAVIVVLLLGAVLFANGEQFKLSALPAVPWVAMAAAIGQAVRGKKAHVALLVERARRAEETKEAEAQRRVQQERLRIARELHDAVGHHVALISVQAGAMSYLLGSDQDKARESLAHIQQASESALEELRLTVGLLRQPGEAEPLEPVGGLDRLGELSEAFAVTGLRVSCQVTGDTRPLPEAVDLTAYRVIQESLTNVSKHAVTSAASVRIDYRPGWLRLEVTNEGPAVQAPPAAEGHGILGMRERAATVGGLLTAGPRPGGGFQVLAELPAGAP